MFPDGHLDPLREVLVRRRTSFRRELIDHLRQRIGQLRQELIARHASLLLQHVDGVVAEHVAELVRVAGLAVAARLTVGIAARIQDTGIDAGGPAARGAAEWPALRRKSLRMAQRAARLTAAENVAQDVADPALAASG